MKTEKETVTLSDGSTMAYLSKRPGVVIARHRWATGFQDLVISEARWKKLHDAQRTRRENIGRLVERINSGTLFQLPKEAK